MEKSLVQILVVVAITQLEKIEDWRREGFHINIIWIWISRF